MSQYLSCHFHSLVQRSFLGVSFLLMTELLSMLHRHNLVLTGLVLYISSLFFLRTMRDYTLGYMGSKPCLWT